jgi:MSHA pilin protein MshA
MASNSHSISRQAGFTLIELIVVLVVLGVLAAVAVPRYVNLRREALISTMHGLKGALQSTATLVYAKAAIAGVADQPSASIDIGGETIDLVYGYPAGTASGIVRLLDPLPMAGRVEKVT